MLGKIYLVLYLGGIFSEITEITKRNLVTLIVDELFLLILQQIRLFLCILLILRVFPLNLLYSLFTGRIYVEKNISLFWR